MNVRRTITALVAALIAAPVLAGSVSAPMRVSVQVIARAIVSVDAQPTVNVTAADVARGYVEVHALMHARTNSRSGYLLQVAKTSDEFASVAIELPDASMHVVSDGSWIRRPYVPGGEAVPVSARLFLAPGTAVGTHALPISFSASPL